MTKINANQIRHLQRIIHEPGTVDSGVCLGNGWNARTFESLEKRGLIFSNADTHWTYYSTPAGVAALQEVV